MRARMLSRLRKTAGALRATLMTCGAFLWSERQELGIVIGLAVLCAGLWMVSPAAALVVAGAVLLWMHLPSRTPFVHRPPDTTARRKN